MEEIPLCTSCGHCHEQGIKCTVCGHVGKSQIFAKMRSRSNDKRSYRLENHNPQETLMTDDTIDLITDIRSLHDNADLLPYSNDHLWDNVDNHCNHIIMYIGDIAIGAMRFQSIPSSINTSNGVTIFVDKAIMHPKYRKKGLFWKLLSLFFPACIQSNMCIYSLAILVPVKSWMESRCIQLGFSKTEELKVFDYDRNKFTLLSVSLTDSSSLQQFVGFLATQTNKYDSTLRL